MSKRAIKNAHFRERIGSSATRAWASGHSDFGDVELQDTCICQLNRLVGGAGTDEEFNRMGGHLRRVLHNKQREEFEKIFVSVASARLPKDAFLQIAEESRRIWRGEFEGLVPPDHKHMKKIRKMRKIASGGDK